MIQDWSDGKMLYIQTSGYKQCPYASDETCNPYFHKLANGIGVPTALDMQWIFTIRNLYGNRRITYLVQEGIVRCNTKPIFTLARPLEEWDDVRDYEYQIRDMIIAITTGHSKIETPRARYLTRMIYDMIEAMFNPNMTKSLYGFTEFTDEYLWFKSTLGKTAIDLVNCK